MDPVRDFWLGLIRDPGSKDASSTRVAGLLCIVAGITWAFLFHNSPVVHKVVGGFVAGGGVALLLRKSSRPSWSSFGDDVDDAPEDELIDEPSDLPDKIDISPPDDRS